MTWTLPAQCPDSFPLASPSWSKDKGLCSLRQTDHQKKNIWSRCIYIKICLIRLKVALKPCLTRNPGPFGDLLCVLSVSNVQLRQPQNWKCKVSECVTGKVYRHTVIMARRRPDDLTNAGGLELQAGLELQSRWSLAVLLEDRKPRLWPQWQTWEKSRETVG